MNALETKPKRNRGTGRPPGRPSKLTPALVEEICALIRDGVPPEPAAVSLGVAVSTFRAWIALGRSPEATPRHREFLLAFDQANAECHAMLAGRAAKDPKLTIEVLARRYHGEWARQDRQSVDVSVSHRPFIDPTRGTLAQLQTFRELAAIFMPDSSELPKDGAPAGELIAASIDGVVLREEDV